MQPGRYFWTVIGFGAVAFSAWLLYHELRGLSLDELWDSITAISGLNWLLCILATMAAYAALAGYDHLALLHLGKRVNWLFITVTSFTTYALSHNIGASVVSGSLVRYRAYSTKGLTAAEVGVLVAFCSFTFALGVVLLAGLALVAEPDLTERFVDVMPGEVSAASGAVLLGAVLLYVVVSILELRPLRLGRLKIVYPRPGIVARQLIIGPLEIVGAAAILYFALPPDNPGFVVVLGIFVLSFSLALLSHAPGGLGVLEITVLTGLAEMDQADVLAALLVFRFLYLIVPLIIGLVIVLVFEHRQLAGMESEPNG